MKRSLICLLLSFFLIASCTNAKDAKKMFAELPETSECIKDPKLAEKTIKKLDEIIKLAPDWWDPYHLKIGLYAILEDDGNNSDKQIIEVYEKWASKNSMDIQKYVAYATHLENIGEKEKAKEAMQHAWNDFCKMEKKQPKDWQEEILMFAGVYAGINLGNITKDNIKDYYYVAERSPDMIVALKDMIDSNTEALFLWD